MMEAEQDSPDPLVATGQIRGFKVGVSVVLMVWMLWDSLVDPPLGADFWHDPALRIYRGLGNLILLLWMWLLSVFLWPRYGINYAKLLNLGGRKTDLLSDALDLSIAFLVSLICFYKAIRGVFLKAVSPSLAHLFPLALLLFVLYKATTPWDARKPVFTAVIRVLLAPFGESVTFCDGYVGDILTSLVRVLIDLAFTVLFFAAGIKGWATDRTHISEDHISTTWFFQHAVVPMLTAGPLWWRFCQNIQKAHETQQRWPHIGNALKYASAQTVSLWGVWQPQLHNSPLWIAAFVFATLYQFTWDITMDWGLLRIRRDAENQPSILIRRNRLVAGGRLSVYVVVAAINLALRFIWTLSLLPEKGNQFIMPELQLYLSPVIAAAEICRRTMWGIFRYVSWI